MWIHLLALELIDGAGGGAAAPAAAGWYDDVKPKKKKLYWEEKKAEEITEQVIKKAKKKKPVVYQEIEPEQVQEVAQKFEVDAEALAIAAKRAQLRLEELSILAAQMRQQEEDDLGVILEGEQQEYMANLARIDALVQAGVFKSWAAEVKYKPAKQVVKVEKKPKVDASESLKKTLAVVMAAIEKINSPKTVIRDESGRIKGIA